MTGSGGGILRPDRAEAAAQVDAAVAAFGRVLRDGDDLATPAVGRWTARDVAAHVAGGFELYVQLLAVSDSPATSIEAIAELNEQALAATRERDPRVLADRLATGAAACTAAARAADGDPEVAWRPEVAWHAGLRLPLSSLLAVSLGEALGPRARPPPRRPGTVADPGRLGGHGRRGTLPVPPFFLSGRAAGVRARVEIRHRGRNAPRATLSFADGVLAVRPGPATEPVDCHVCADPAVHLLLSYGRIGPSARRSPDASSPGDAGPGWRWSFRACSGPLSAP